MGLFDTLTILHDLARCPDGHDLSAAEWQTKDLGRAMLGYVLDETGELKPVDQNPEPWGAADYPPSGPVQVYTHCDQCPVWVQKGTGNVIHADVDCDLQFEGVKLTGYQRTTPSYAEQLVKRQASAWFEGAVGPVSDDEAHDLSSAYRLLGYSNDSHPKRAEWRAICARHGVNPEEWHTWAEERRKAFLAELSK